MSAGCKVNSVMSLNVIEKKTVIKWSELPAKTVLVSPKASKSPSKLHYLSLHVNR